MKTAAARLPETRRASRRVRLAVAAALVVALALRLAFAFGYWVNKPLTLDEQEYLLLGDSLAHGEGLRYPAADGASTRHFERPPVFAVFVAGVTSLTGQTLPRHADSGTRMLPSSSSAVAPSVRLAQALVGVLVVLLAAIIAGQIAGPAAAGAAALVAGFYPPLVWSCAYVLAEPLYSALALGCICLLHRGVIDKEPKPALLLAAGLVAGVAVLTKEAIIFFVPLAAAWLLVRARLRAALAFCFAVTLVLAPWVAHNYRTYGRFVLTAPHGGVTFWTGNNPLSPGEGDLAANPEMGRARGAFEDQHRGSSAEDLDSAYYREAWRFIRSDPIGWLWLVARKFFYTFVPLGPSYRLHSALYFGASLLSYGVLAVMAAAGLLKLRAARRLRDGWALWLLAVSAVLMCLVFFPQERFRIPVLDPTLVVCASAWLASRPAVTRLFSTRPDQEALA